MTVAAAFAAGALGSFWARRRSGPGLTESNERSIERLASGSALGLKDHAGGQSVGTSERQQLEFRSREPGLHLLCRRWRDRSDELHVIAERMTTDNADTLHGLAQQWSALASQLEEVERLERSEALLGPVVGRPRKLHTA